MKNNHTTAKPSLKDVKKSLNANQELTADMQCNLKGGDCTNCEDSRRPPRGDRGPMGGSGSWGSIGK